MNRRLRSLAFYALLGTVSSCLLRPGGDVPRVIATPREIDLGDPIAVRIEGLAAGESIELVTETVHRGEVVRSAAVFRAPEDGVVDPLRQAPLDGDWSGSDPRGPFWSLAPTGVTCDRHAPSQAIEFQVLRGSEVIARTEVKRWLRRPGVRSEAVTAEGLVARFFVPAAEESRPTVLLVGGSGGGLQWQSEMALALANRGYAALALAYFGLDGLPDDLDEIPLEYFDRAIDWLRARPEVDSNRLAVAGISKGGELALLLGATRADLRAVVAFVPSSVVWQGIAPGWPRRSSWSRAGVGLPFVPYDSNASVGEAGLTELYRASLRAEGAVAAAAIPVERSAGPILLFSGGADRIWPSTLMCEQVIGRLRDRGFAYGVEHVAYPDAGHSIAAPTCFATAAMARNGGTGTANAEAIADGWRRTLEFLATRLGR